MNLNLTGGMAALCVMAIFQAVAVAQPALVAEKMIPTFFPGSNRLRLVWTNQGAEQIDTEIKGKIFQGGSKLAMALPIELTSKLQLLPKQAALMPLTLETPEVRGKTLLVVQWRNGAQKGIGTSEMNVYPRDILHELETIAGDKPLGLVATNKDFAEALKNSGSKFEEMQRDEIRGYEGKLLIVTDFARPDEPLIEVARRGATVICIMPQDEKILRPTFFASPYGKGVIVFVQERFVEDFAVNPESQLRLVEICRLAIKPGRPELPILFPKDHNEN